MAVEDFTTYTEVDPNDRITVTSTKVSWALLTDEIAYVYLDKGANFFIGDFEFYLTYRDAGGVSADLSLALPWALANLLNDHKAIDDASGDLLGLWGGKREAGTIPIIQLEELDGGTPYYSASYDLSPNTDYYLKITRDEAVGTFGTLYCYVYSDVGRTTLLTTLSVTLHSTNNFRYLYALMSTTGTGANSISGYTENLSLESAEVQFTWPSDPVTRVSSIIHRYDRGIYNMEIGFGDIIAGFGIPRAETGTDKSYEGRESKLDKEEETPVYLPPGDVRTIAEILRRDKPAYESLELNMLKNEIEKLAKQASSTGITSAERYTLNKRLVELMRRLRE